MQKWSDEFVEGIRRFLDCFRPVSYWRRQFIADCAEKGGAQQFCLVRRGDFSGKVPKQQLIYGGKRWKKKIF